MDKTALLSYLEKLDAALETPATLCVYGGAALILLDEPGRTSVDIDVAAPYSRASFPDLERAAAAAGLPVNPMEETAGDHIEWIQPIRLCLAPPQQGKEIVLWRGSKLTIITVPIPDLVASKLIRYDEIDQADLAYLLAHHPMAWAPIEDAIRRLPPPFDSDPVIRDNMGNLRVDIEMRKGPHDSA